MLNPKMNNVTPFANYQLNYIFAFLYSKTMKKITLSFFVILSLMMAVAQNSTYVNPFIGTKSMGHVFPGAVAPHGIIALSPDTDTVPHNVDGKYQPEAYRYCAGYQYDDPTIV